MKLHIFCGCSNSVTLHVNKQLGTYKMLKITNMSTIVLQPCEFRFGLLISSYNIHLQIANKYA